jgi:hypothetical protein
MAALDAFLHPSHPVDCIMAEKVGHFRVTQRQDEILRLERRSPFPLVVAVMGSVFLVLLWLLRPWQSPSGVIVTAFIIVPLIAGLSIVLYHRPWKEVLVFNRALGNFTKEEQYLIRRNKITSLPLDSIESVGPVQRTARFVDKKGERVEHVYWAALLRSTDGREVELDGANSQERMREFARAVNSFLADFDSSSP